MIKYAKLTFVASIAYLPNLFDEYNNVVFFLNVNISLINDLDVDNCLVF